jgi:hypothetical protein
MWTSSFKSIEAYKAAKYVWAIALQRYDMRKVAKATNECFEVYDRPPSLPQFLKLFKKTQLQGLNSRSMPEEKKLPEMTENQRLALKQRNIDRMAKLKKQYDIKTATELKAEKKASRFIDEKDRAAIEVNPLRTMPDKYERMQNDIYIKTGRLPSLQELINAEKID